VNIVILLFVVLLLLSLPGAFMLKLCQAARDGNSVSRLFMSKWMRGLNRLLGYALFILSLTAIAINLWRAGLAFAAGEMQLFSPSSSPGMIIILLYPLISLWLARLMRNAAKHGCGAV